MKILLAVAVLLMSCSPACAQKKVVEAANAKARGLVGNPAPEFSLPGLSEKTFRLGDERGRVVVLAFWATWCPPCRGEVPGFAKLQKEMAPLGVDVTLIAVDEPAKAQEFLTKKKFDVRSLVDQEHTVARAYGANALPKTILINREGVVVQALIGKQSESKLREAIDEVRK